MCCRFAAVVDVHFGDYTAFNDYAIRLCQGYNDSRRPDDLFTKPMKYQDAIRILCVFSYNFCVKYFSGGGVHNGHRAALGLSFLNAARFFGGEFRRKEYTGKVRKIHDEGLARENSFGKDDGITALTSCPEGVNGRLLHGH